MTPLKKYHNEPAKKHRNPSCHNTSERIFGADRSSFDKWDNSRRTSGLNKLTLQIKRIGEDNPKCVKETKKTDCVRNEKESGDGCDWGELRHHERSHKRHRHHKKGTERGHGDGYPLDIRDNERRDQSCESNLNELDERYGCHVDKVSAGASDKKKNRERGRYDYKEHSERKQSNSGDVSTWVRNFEHGVKRDKGDGIKSKRERGRYDYKEHSERKQSNSGDVSAWVRNFEHGVKRDKGDGIKSKKDERHSSFDITDTLPPKQKMRRVLTSTPLPDSRDIVNPLVNLMDDTVFNKKYPQPLYGNMDDFDTSIRLKGPGKGGAAPKTDASDFEMVGKWLINHSGIKDNHLHR
jgi:hypothetical protein